MRNRVLEIEKRSVENDKLFAVVAYNEYYLDGSFCQKLAISSHSFDQILTDEEVIEWVRINVYKQERYKDLERTECVHTYIEEKRDGYVRYVNTKGKRWEVFGYCTGIGKCYEGASNPTPYLDCPITENFTKDCCDLTVNVIEQGE
jgi:hypothetical protein